MCDCSAAKAPYRATFRVQTVGIERVERCADPHYNCIADAGGQYDQMVIFKVGDDVRQVGTRVVFAQKTNGIVRQQDMLALQLMRLFQNIFEQEGLDLYMYTYRVVATSPGVRNAVCMCPKCTRALQCGVIECVPDSRSRDEIGRSTEVGLFEYFRHKHGKPDSSTFQTVTVRL